MLSLGFTRIGAAAKLGFTLFLAAPQTVGPSEPFVALTLNDLDAPTLQRNDYAKAVETAVAARGSQAFVLESSTTLAGIAANAPGLTRFIDEGATITRATTLLLRERISEDVFFAKPFEGELPSQRWVSVDGPLVRHAGLGSLGLLLLAGAARRSRGRKPNRRNKSTIG